MTDVTYQLVKLEDLMIAPTNARFGREVATEDLQTSIAGAGRLVTPLSCYPRLKDGTGGWLVWDGGRRLLALQALAKAKKLPAGLKAGVPCLLYPEEHAATLQRDSLATFVREGMTPADEFEAIQRLVGFGLSITETAAGGGLRTARVQQLQRLVNLAPEVLADFKASKIPLDVAEAFTLTESHDRQREVLKAFNPKKDTGWGVRAQFRKGAMESTNRWARFVGRDAYLVAGGTFLNDLFSNNQQEDWADPELAARLAKEKLDALVKKTEAEGWEWVSVDERRDYGWDKGFDRIAGKKSTFTLEEKAKAGVSIYVGYNGQVEIERGLVKKPKGATTAAGQQAQANPELYGYGHGGHEALTGIATGAVQVALAGDPEAAYDALLSSLAWTVFRENGRGGQTGGAWTDSSYHGNASALQVDQGRYGFQTDEVVGMVDLKARAKVWRDTLPMDRVEFCDHVAALKPAEKADLLAIAFAWTVSAVEHRHDARMPVRWANLAWMARRARVDIAQAWRPTKEFMLKGSKDAICAAIDESGENSEAFRDCKKSLLVDYAMDFINKAYWTPKLLTDAFGKWGENKSAKAKAPKAKPESKRMYKDQLAADMAAVAAGEAQEGQEAVLTPPVAAAGEQPQE